MIVEQCEAKREERKKIQGEEVNKKAPCSFHEIVVLRQHRPLRNELSTAKTRRTIPRSITHSSNYSTAVFFCIYYGPTIDTCEQVAFEYISTGIFH